ncbi:MAG: hypothetical protein L6R36_008281 [Xanthoria steineri]|nr:MAG: hypothetical protein L6R36_008281 [Xanthoria steineri]
MATLRYVRQVWGEKAERYRIGGYHPTHIGDTYKEGRYKILHKLGYGGFATVWLARDTEANRYVALKIIMANERSNKLELKMFEYLANQHSDHPGKQHLVTLLDRFVIQGPYGKHNCLVLPFLGPSVPNQAAGYLSKMLDSSLARRVATQLSESLAYMHSVGIGHGDCHTMNIVFKLKGIEAWTEDHIYKIFGRPKCQLIERNGPCPECIDGPKYMVQQIDMSRIDSRYISNDIVLIDYGLSFSLDNPPSWLGTITNYRAPEAEFDGQVSKACDIWALGCIIYELLTGVDLFQHDKSIYRVLSRMVPILGLFPAKWWRWHFDREYLDLHYFHDIWRPDQEPIVPTTVPINPRSRSKRKGKDNKVSLLALDRSPHLQLSTRRAAALAELLGSMLCYDPHQRISAEQVLQHRFLRPDSARMFKCSRIR